MLAVCLSGSTDLLKAVGWHAAVGGPPSTGGVAMSDLVINPLDEQLDALEPNRPETAAAKEAETGAAGLSVPHDACGFLELSLRDDGGPEDMPVRRASRHQYRAVLHEAIVRVVDALDTGGVVDNEGRLRRSWISSLESLIREARALDETLGLDPRAATAKPKAAPGVELPKYRPSLPAEIEAFFDRMDEVEESFEKKPSRLS